MKKHGRATHKSTPISGPISKLPQGHVAFRLLCSHHAGSAVIGHGGSVSKTITRDAGGTKLRVEDTLPGCDERTVNIVGPGSLVGTLVLREGGGGEIEVEVSGAQVVLFRVLDIVEAYSPEGLRCCRLLTAKGEEKIKPLGGGVVVGATVRVLPTAEYPLCAAISDDLIQITGDSQAVRKALLAVTYCLQGNISRAISLKNSVSDGISHDLHAPKHRIPDTDAGDRGQSCIVVGTKEVAYRLLCPTYVADELIDWGGSSMRALKKETGARIELLVPVVGCAECVVMISAMENKEWQYSPAQEAILRVFTRLMEAASESEHASGSNRGEYVTARLLISHSQANMLDINDTAGAEVLILESDCTPAAYVGKKIIQIVGEYSDVHTCLLQVTWTLRELIVSRSMVDAPLLPHQLYGRPSHVHAASTIADEVDNLTISHDTHISLSPTEEVVADCSLCLEILLTGFRENHRDVMSSCSSSELESGDDCAIIRNSEVEVVVPAHVFFDVYGEGGVNLALLRQTSGASVIVMILIQEPMVRSSYAGPLIKPLLQRACFIAL